MKNGTERGDSSLCEKKKREWKREREKKNIGQAVKKCENSGTMRIVLTAQ